MLTPEESEAHKKVTISSDVGKHNIVPLDAQAQVIKRVCIFFGPDRTNGPG